MCEYCKPLVEKENPKKNLTSVSFANKESDDKNRGMTMFMGKTNRKFKIENNTFVRDETIDTPIIYLEAIKWRKKPNPTAWTTAVEISYCPFCGEKL